MIIMMAALITEITVPAFVE